jgi:hypothetical protein
MKTARIHRAAALRGRRGVIVSLGAIALIAAALSSCGARTGSPVAAPPSRSANSPSETATQASPTPSVTPASWRRITSPPFWNGPSVWDGNEILAVHYDSTWDKRADVERCSEVAAAYNPLADAWRMLPPVPRIRPASCACCSGDTAIWTGTEMLLWGATNSAYDPATNTWRRLTAPPTDELAPSVSVWTGRQMIGWGSVDCCGVPDTTGFAFTPATGAVTQLPDSPLQGGGGPVAAWTGTEMIVAGGGFPEGGYVYDDVAAYRPSTRTWHVLPSMPVSRIDGTALWDGTELLIFGGSGGPDTESGRNPSFRTHALSRGVAFDPTTNTWRWLPAPETPRIGAVYAWDGSEVLMWGGIGLDRSVPSHGEAFDPVTNVWSPLPASPLRARVWPSQVWTGSDLIVWGGMDARRFAESYEGKELGDGAAFTPASA